MALHLYYDDKKGLIKAQNYAVGNSVMEHNEKGWDAPHHEQVLEILGQNVKIVVNTNLGWGPKSYMNAKITMMDKSVLNFHDTSLKHSVMIVYAEPSNWDMLFDGVIKLYNSIYNSETQINAYFDEIVKRTVDATDQTVDEFVEITTRLAELANGIASSIFSDNATLKNRMRTTCGLVIRHISTDLDKKLVTESQHDKIESNLHSIFRYLTERDEILDTLTITDPTIIQ